MGRQSWQEAGEEEVAAVCCGDREYLPTGVSGGQCGRSGVSCGGGG